MDNIWQASCIFFQIHTSLFQLCLFLFYYSLHVRLAQFCLPGFQQRLIKCQMPSLSEKKFSMWASAIGIGSLLSFCPNLAAKSSIVFMPYTTINAHTPIFFYSDITQRGSLLKTRNSLISEEHNLVRTFPQSKIIHFVKRKGQMVWPAWKTTHSIVVPLIYTEPSSIQKVISTTLLLFHTIFPLLTYLFFSEGKKPQWFKW